MLKHFKILILICLNLYSYQSFNIDDFGAIHNDPSYDAAITNGKAFNSALQAANSSLSDRSVIIDAGKWYGMLPDGVIDRLINVTIQLNGKLNSWDDDHSRYPTDTNGHVFDFISIQNTEGLVVSGTGTIEGNGYSWWLNVFQTGVDNRPNLIDLYNSKNLIIDGITVLNAPQYHINVLDALNATIQNVVIYVDIAYNSSTAVTFPLNTDGIDISGKDIYFRNLTIVNFDDAVAVKPTRIGGVWSNCTENLLIEDSYVKYGVGKYQLKSINKTREILIPISYRNFFNSLSLIA